MLSAAKNIGKRWYLCKICECLPRDARREDEIARLEIPYTVVRAGEIQEDPGGNSELRLAHVNASTAEGRKVSRGDLARVLVGALDASPGASLTISVSNVVRAFCSNGVGSVFDICVLHAQVTSAGAGSPPEDWAAAFSALQADASSTVDGRRT